ncbi:MAG TPA: cation-translocating P-type ATPase, partial [Minicystis sp.]|nr:cation-translocating P-type ATPase [Minicystis sp.]
NDAPARSADEAHLALYGLLGFRDPLRPAVPAAVAECQTAGIEVKMITGDHALTARAIARAAGVVHGDDAVVTGPELAAAAPEERARLVARAAIFARIDPAQKHEIVEILRRRGEVVAMTGDGVNDAPALRHAHIGIAMGRRGTDVARAAADLVLLDDDFVSIVATVREGRHILAKIQTAFLYLLAFHVPIVALALIAPLLGLPLILKPLHFVWLELIVHPISAFVFEGEPPAPDLMTRPPRAPSAALLPKAPTRNAFAVGATLTLAILVVYRAALPAGEPHARAMAIATQILGSQLLTLVERVALQPRGVSFWPRTARFWIVWTLAGATLVPALWVPAIARALELAPLGARDLTLTAVAALAAVGWVMAFDVRASALRPGLSHP